MTQEEKALLLKDLSTRLPYGVICHANEINIDGELIFVNKLYNIAALYCDNATGKFESCPINDIRPYLRPISSMTEEELNEYENFITNEKNDQIRFCNELIFYNSHHFDYRGLIPKGLALEAPEDMYKLKQK